MTPSMKKTTLTGALTLALTLIAAQASAYTIELQMQNDETQGGMTCEVYRINGDEETKIKTYKLSKKRGTRRNRRTFRFDAPLKSRTISGVSTYYEMKLKCWNPSQKQSRYTAWSYAWDHADKPFDQYEFSGYCQVNSAPCSATIKRKR